VRTHLSSNLSRENPTIAVPFSVFPDATFAGRLKKLRIERGLKQTELSLKAGLNRDLVYLWEREYRRPRQRSLERVAGVLGVEVECLQAGRKSVAAIGRRRRLRAVADRAA
jgi:transcriptional regulator with XRE-family HTH domain